MSEKVFAASVTTGKNTLTVHHVMALIAGTTTTGATITILWIIITAMTGGTVLLSIITTMEKAQNPSAIIVVMPFVKPTMMPAMVC